MTRTWLDSRLGEVVRGLRSRAPATPEHLWQFIRAFYGLAVPRRRVCPGHSSPFDYVVASYFQTHGDLVIWANRGGAKTELGSVTTHLDSLFRPGCETRILGGSLQQSERMYEYLGTKWRPHFADCLAREPHHRRTELRNGSRIEILAQSERSVRGQRVQRVKCDEVDEFDLEVWQAVQFVTQSKPGIRSSIEAFSTMHHPHGLMSEVVDRVLDGGGIGVADDMAANGGRHGTLSGEGEAALRRPGLLVWCLWETIERCTSDRSCSRCLLAEDCQGRAREAEGFLQIDDAIAQKRRSGREAWESEMLCRRPRTENLVFPGFSRATHVGAAEYDGRWPVYRTLDFGYANPFVCLWVQLVGDDPETARLVVLDEYVQRQKKVSEHAAVLKERPWPVRATFCDPAGRQRGDVTGSGACEELARLGILTRSSASGIMEGVDRIRALLEPAVGPARLVIEPRCGRLIRALEAYHYPAGASLAARELPDKDGEHDHLIDALRYLVVHLFGRGRGEMRETAYW
jgi:hypothetical protein